MDVVAAGFDPSIGFLHASGPNRPAFVLDLMEPRRPIVDRKVLEFVQAHMFHPADFTIRADGVCRLNPEMAKYVANLTLRRLGGYELDETIRSTYKCDSPRGAARSYKLSY